MRIISLVKLLDLKRQDYMSEVFRSKLMTEIQTELGYDGFLKELDFLESLLVNFVNSLTPETKSYIWRHSEKLLRNITELKSSSFLNSNNCVKRQKFDKFLFSIHHFQEKIARREGLEYFSSKPTENDKVTKLINQVRVWEKIAFQINHNYIPKL
jgi:hypothetical protein